MVKSSLVTVLALIGLVGSAAAQSRPLTTPPSRLATPPSRFVQPTKPIFAPGRPNPPVQVLPPRGAGVISDNGLGFRR